MTTWTKVVETWVCHDCDHESMGYEDAVAHAEHHDHWVYEHRHGYRGNPPTRSMHASDMGGVYVDPVSERDAVSMTSRWRETRRGGAF